MTVFRFLAALFLLVAIIALVADATGPLAGHGSFAPTAFSSHWADLAPASLTAFRNAVITSTPGWLWDPVIISVIDEPTFVLFGVLALLCGIAGRRRHEINIFVN